MDWHLAPTEVRLDCLEHRRAGVGGSYRGCCFTFNANAFTSVLKRAEHDIDVDISIHLGAYIPCADSHGWSRGRLPKTVARVLLANAAPSRGEPRWLRLRAKMPAYD